MQRVPESELMDDEEHARAYANADFEAPHSRYVTLFERYFRVHEITGTILDLGCGPGDVTFRFARRFREAYVVGVDGSNPMICIADGLRVRDEDLARRIRFVCGMLPGIALPPGPYGAILCTNLLHHLHRPRILWSAIENLATPGTMVFVADLFRPASEEDARRLVDTYAANEPEALRSDFFHSLLAAFEPAEIADQLRLAGLDYLTVHIVSDRHVVVSGRA